MRAILKFLKSIIILSLTVGVLTGGLLLYARYLEPNLLTITQVAQNSTKIEQPFKIVFFSDTHFGSLYPEKKIEAIVEKINQQEADLVIFGGDFFDAYAKDKKQLNLPYLMENLQKIKAKTAKVAIWGNHDYGGGASRVYEDFITESGFTLLTNETLKIAELNLNILGLDDYLLGNPDTSMEKFEDLDPLAYNLLITHAPDVVDDLDLSQVDLVLAGHSHGGQVTLPLITTKILPPGAQKYVKGLYDLSSENESQLFVSIGLGVTQLPYRFLNPPEVVVIDITLPEN